jgi:hypothetical protein
MLFIKNIKLKNSSQKFSHKFVESFRIVETMNKQIYRLIFFSFYRIHDVFHVFYLKSYKKRKNDNIISKYLSSELLDDDEVNEVKKILQKKISKKIIYYLIKWKDWSKKYKKWITKKNMNAFVKVLHFAGLSRVETWPDRVRLVVSHTHINLCIVDFLSFSFLSQYSLIISITK